MATFANMSTHTLAQTYPLDHELKVLNLTLILNFVLLRKNQHYFMGKKCHFNDYMY